MDIPVSQQLRLWLESHNYPAWQNYLEKADATDREAAWKALVAHSCSLAMGDASETHWEGFEKSWKLLQAHSPLQEEAVAAPNLIDILALLGRLPAIEELVSRHHLPEGSGEKNSHGGALFSSIRRGQREVVEYLVGQGARVDGLAALE